MALRIHNDAIVRSTLRGIRRSLPHTPLLCKELREPLTIDSVFAVEEPNEIVQVAAIARTRHSRNHSVTGKIAGTSGDVAIHKEVSPGTMIRKEHRLSRVDGLRLLHNTDVRLKEIGNLFVSKYTKTNNLADCITGTLSPNQAKETISSDHAATPSPTQMR